MKTSPGEIIVSVLAALVVIVIVLVLGLLWRKRHEYEESISRGKHVLLINKLTIITVSKG